MARFICWFLVLAAGCSGVPVREGALDLIVTPTSSRQTSTRTTEPVNSTSSTLTEVEGSSQIVEGRHFGSTADELALSAGIRGHGTNAGGGVVTMTQLKISTESPAATAESLPKMEITTRSPSASMLPTKLHNDQKVIPELLLPLQSTAKSPTLSKIASESAPSQTTTWSSASAKIVHPEFSAPLPVSAVSVAETGGRSVPAHGELSSPPAADDTGELSVPLGGVGRSRHRPEPGLGPARKKPSRGRFGVPELEMLENPSKPRKGVSQPPEPDPTPAEDKPSSRRTGVPDLEMLENLSKPRKGVPPTAGGPDAAEASPPGSAALGESARPHVYAAYAGPEELAGEPEMDPNLAKARISMTIGIVFVALFVLVLCWFVFRKISDSWHHRHYRKMDFLVDGMYNF